MIRIDNDKEVECQQHIVIDLRKKAMEALDEGESREAVAARFKIGRTTLWEWQHCRLDHKLC